MSGKHRVISEFQERRRANDEGIALVIVLLFIVLLVAIVVEYAYEIQVESSFVMNYNADFQAYTAARSAVAVGQSLLATDILNPDESAASEYDALTDVWAQEPTVQPLNDAVMMTTVTAENGKIPLNALFPILDQGEIQGGSTPEAESQSTTVQEPDPILVRALEVLFETRGVEESPVNMILDWIDTDTDERDGGAESSFYESQEISYGCPDAPLKSVEELLMIPGITPDIFFGNPDENQLPLTELLTVHGDRDGRINPNTAELEVLVAMGEAINHPELAELYEPVREPGGAITDIKELEQYNPTRNREDPVTDENKPRMRITSDFFRIRGDAASGDTNVRVEAYVERSGQSGGAGSFRILDWRVIR